ncbi:phage minor tail protein L [Hypericibacter terrae]|nr:phage minor tail protein L [Hypericibacter terrae]
MTETLEQAVQSPSVGDRVHLFTLDAVAQGAPEIYRFSPTSDRGQPILFNGLDYTPMDIMAEGFEWNGRGALPTPKITVQNVTRAMSALVQQAGDLRGATLTRIRTFRQFLDNGDSPSPDAFFGPDIFTVERKSSLNKFFVEFELSAKLDQEGKILPARQILRNRCRFRYRRFVDGDWDYTGATCPYAGTLYFDKAGNPVSIESDSCGKKLADCALRFGSEPLPFSGFPGVARVR